MLNPLFIYATKETVFNGYLLPHYLLLVGLDLNLFCNEAILYGITGNATSAM